MSVTVSLKIILFIILVFCNLNIVCQTLDEDQLFPVKIIKEENYPVEVHEVLTEDDYILTTHRIPPKSSENSIPVYIQHGIFSSSGDWVLSGKNYSLAYFLWDNGFDVWIGNARGNTYSKRHKTLSIEDPKFWNFSFHELGIYDVPANIQYIKNLTNKKIFYVGHSMGCSSFSIMAINKPEIAQNIRAMIALAPAPYEYHVTLPLFKLLSINWQLLWTFASRLGIKQVLSRNFLTDLAQNQICTVPINIGPTICKYIVRLLEGSNIRKSLSPLISESFPSGTSLKLFVHWLQHMEVNKFQQFDYGSEGNMEIYGSSTPPNYDLTKIEIPIALFYSDDDNITPAEDVLHFYEQMPEKLGKHKVIGPSFGHLDFLWGDNTTELLNEPILKIFRSFV